MLGDANVDLTVAWKDVEQALPSLSEKNRALVKSCAAESIRLKSDLEYYLPCFDEELSTFFSSLAHRSEPGGCGAIKAMTLARLGHNIAFHSWVGDDERGRTILDALSTAGLDTSHIMVTGRTCETYNIFRPGLPRVAFSYWENKLDLSAFLKGASSQNPVFLTGAHRIKEGLGYSRLPGAYVFTGSFATYSKSELARKYKSDFSKGIIVGNDSEIMQLSGCSDPIEGLAKLGNDIIVMHGPLQTAVKRGSDIISSDTGGKIEKSRVKELTGIGDVWEATFLGSVGCLAEAPPAVIESCMRKASKAAVRRMLGEP